MPPRLSASARTTERADREDCTSLSSSASCDSITNNHTALRKWSAQRSINQNSPDSLRVPKVRTACRSAERSMAVHAIMQTRKRDERTACLTQDEHARRNGHRHRTKPRELCNRIRRSAAIEQVWSETTTSAHRWLDPHEPERRQSSDRCERRSRPKGHSKMHRAAQAV